MASRIVVMFSVLVAVFLIGCCSLFIFNCYKKRKQNKELAKKHVEQQKAKEANKDEESPEESGSESKSVS